MKFIKYFVLITTIICFFGCLMLINDGEFEFYAFWNMVAYTLATYALFKK